MCSLKVVEQFRISREPKLQPNVASKAKNPQRPDETTDWPGEARRVVKSLLAREGVTYAALVERLRVIGVEETESSIANKMTRGTFPLVFLLQCMRALEKSQVTIDLPRD